MKAKKIIYWIVTALLCLMMLLQGIMFTFNSEQIAQLFNRLNMPTMLIIPIGIAKLLGIIAIVSRKNLLLKDLAYYGFFIDFVAAISVHLAAGQADFKGALFALVLVSVSFFLEKKVFIKSI